MAPVGRRRSVSSENPDTNTTRRSLSPSPDPLVVPYDPTIGPGSSPMRILFSPSRDLPQQEYSAIAKRRRSRLSTVTAAQSSPLRPSSKDLATTPSRAHEEPQFFDVIAAERDSTNEQDTALDRPEMENMDIDSDNHQTVQIPLNDKEAATPSAKRRRTPRRTAQPLTVTEPSGSPSPKRRARRGRPRRKATQHSLDAVEGLLDDIVNADDEPGEYSLAAEEGATSVPGESQMLAAASAKSASSRRPQGRRIDFNKLDEISQTDSPSHKIRRRKSIEERKATPGRPRRTRDVELLDSQANGNELHAESRPLESGAVYTGGEELDTNMSDADGQMVFETAGGPPSDDDGLDDETAAAQPATSPVENTEQLDRSLAESEGFTLVSFESLRQSKASLDPIRKPEITVTAANGTTSGKPPKLHPPVIDQSSNSKTTNIASTHEHAEPSMLDGAGDHGHLSQSPAEIRVPRRRNQDRGSSEPSRLSASQTPQEKIRAPAVPARPESPHRPSPLRRISGAVRAGAMLLHAVSEPVSNRIRDLTPGGSNFLGFGNDSARGLRESLLAGEQLRSSEDRQMEEVTRPAYRRPISRMSMNRPHVDRLPTPSEDGDDTQGRAPTEDRSNDAAARERNATSFLDPMSWRREPRVSQDAQNQIVSQQSARQTSEEQIPRARTSLSGSTDDAMSWRPSNEGPSFRHTEVVEYPSLNLNGVSSGTSDHQVEEQTTNMEDIWQEEADRSIEDSMAGKRARRDRQQDEVLADRRIIAEDGSESAPIAGQKRSRPTDQEEENFDLRELLGEDNRPLRSKIPRTWRRSGEHQFLYSDEAEESPDRAAPVAPAADQTASQEVTAKSPAPMFDVPSIFYRLGMATKPPADEVQESTEMDESAQPVLKSILSSPLRRNSPSRRSATPKEVRFAEETEVQEAAPAITNGEHDYFSEPHSDNSSSSSSSGSSGLETIHLTQPVEPPTFSDTDVGMPPTDDESELVEDEVSEGTEQSEEMEESEPEADSAKSPLEERSRRMASAENQELSLSIQKARRPGFDIFKRASPPRGPQPRPAAKESQEEPGLWNRLAAWMPTLSTFGFGSRNRKEPSHHWGRNHYMLLDHIYKTALALDAYRKPPPGPPLPYAYYQSLPEVLASQIGVPYISKAKCGPHCAADCEFAKSKQAGKTFDKKFTDIEARVAHAFIVEVRDRGLPLLTNGKFADEIDDEDNEEYPLRDEEGNVIKKREDWMSKRSDSLYVCSRVVSFWAAAEAKRDRRRALN